MTPENSKMVLDKLAWLEAENKELRNRLVLSKRENDFLRITSNTQRQQFNETSVESKRQGVYIQLLLKSCPDIMFLLDESMHFLFGTDSIKNIVHVDNPAQLEGLTLAQVIEKYPTPFLTPELIINIAYSHRISDTANIPVEVMAEGMTYKASILPTGSHDSADDGFVGVMVVMHDVTELSDAKKEAERISNLKTEFLTHISHELRTPLTSVLGVAEIQLKTPQLPPKTEDAFLRILNASGSLLGIVNDVLDFSKIEAGKIDLVAEPYDTANLVSNISQQRSAYVANKDVQFSLSICPDMPATFLGAQMRIEQVIGNVLSNAMKYTNQGTVDIDVKSVATEGDEALLVVMVQDTGVGMTDMQQKAIFDPYTRFVGQDNSYVAGTGIGMTIALNLVQLMKGTIDIASKVGEGTAVTITIPQKVANGETLGTDMVRRLQQFDLDVYSNSRRASFEPEPMPYGKILVVDDVEDNLLVAQGLLAFYDLDVETCTSGVEAIGKIEDGHVYDIILMDHMMPGIDGVEAMQAIRSLGYTNTIVVFTANALIGNADKFIKSGFDGFISKPINTSHLNALLVKHVKEKQPPEVIAAVLTEKNHKKTTKAAITMDDYLNDGGLKDVLRSNFARRHKNTAQELQLALSKGDTPGAHIMAHSLKSAAGLIDEAVLAGIAQTIEKVISKGLEPSFGLLAEMEEELAMVLGRLTTTPPQPTTQSPPLPEGIDLTATLDTLAPLLKQRNAECQHVAKALSGIPEAATLLQQIEDFEFGAASKSLATLRETLGF